MLSESEFSLLSFLRSVTSSAKEVDTGLPPVPTQRVCAESTSMSLGKVNALLKKFIGCGWINSAYQLLPGGYATLESYKVKNAIIMAAGFSSRFAPLSYEKPKGLLLVKGEVLIERQIRQLHEAGITDITVVVGYKKEAFFYLEATYGVKLVINDDYFRYNNTSTLIRVLDSLSSTYICSSDNYFSENVFEPYAYHSFYAANYAPHDTQEYCLTTARSGQITSVTIGGRASWYMIGHVYFNPEFSETFKKILAEEYKNTYCRYELWEEVYMRHISELPLFIKQYEEDIIWEFDSLDELRLFDSHYVNNADSQVLSHICQTLSCQEQELSDFHVLKHDGITLPAFSFQYASRQWLYSLGITKTKWPFPSLASLASSSTTHGTHSLLDDTSSQPVSVALSSFLPVLVAHQLIPSLVFQDMYSGWSIHHYTENPAPALFSKIQQALTYLQRLHAIPSSELHRNGWTEQAYKRHNTHLHFFLQELELNVHQGDDLSQMYETYNHLRELTSATGVNTHNLINRQVLCNGFCLDFNFFSDGNNSQIPLSWDYSRQEDPAFDVGSLLATTELSPSQIDELIISYLQQVSPPPLNGSSGDKSTTPAPELYRHYIAFISIAAFFWYIWGQYQEKQGHNLGDRIYQWYKIAKDYSKKALKLYGGKTK